MAKGRIPQRDIDAIRERTPIEDVVGDYVQLRSAGSDSMKGLSPFKEEKTPSFHVRPNSGYFYCFSTSQGGDVFKFLMLMEHISFPEAVEQCAELIGYHITYEGGTPGDRVEPGTRQRLVAANRAAFEFYAERLNSSADGADVARAFLDDRGFSPELVSEFGCGYAPSGWDTATKALQRQGFTFQELEAAGLSKMGTKGPIDRFHRRLLWPIRSSTGDVIGFGARKLFEDDKLGKYMNTPETLLYKKSRVLFGLDRAKKHIAEQHRAVVVEGYTDVMAMHAAGVPTAVAACGTAFGVDHLHMLRRLLLDDTFFRGEIIYTFDGDEAGQKAALRAFEGDQEFSGHSFVTVAPSGQDPCDVRLAKGDAAVRELVESRVPMFEFVIRSALAEYDIDTVDGRVAATDRMVPVLASIRDEKLRLEYTRRAAMLTGWADPEDLRPMVARAVQERGAKRPQFHVHSGGGLGSPDREGPRGTGYPHLRAVQGMERPDPAAKDSEMHREVLKLALQEPQVVRSQFDLMLPESFGHPTYVAIAEAVAAAGGAASSQRGATWIEAVAGHIPDPMGRAVVSELAVEQLRCDGEKLADYAGALMARIEEAHVADRIVELKSNLFQRRTDMTDPGYKREFDDLATLERYRRALRAKADRFGPVPGID